MKNHIVAFIDLLGFSTAVCRAKSDYENNNLLELLKAYTKLNNHGTFNEIFPAKDGNVNYQIAPAFTAVSDSIIISYSISTGNENIDNPHFHLNQLMRLISWIAAQALKKGFLIRGGISKGEMYHKNEIFFGKAYIEAYNLESKCANYPRVLISNKMIEYNSKNNDRPLFIEDTDGMYRLNYLPEMIFNNSEKMGYGLSSQALKAQIKEYENIINKNIAPILPSKEPLLPEKEMGKWKWFSHQFNLARDYWYNHKNSHIFFQDN
ncbi:MAG: hypothetical protein K0R14_1961 [Burkholderiales bacterium]|jgi:hypothetical protein|nr:hypothetical protein [Burkholderiales bacterium]